VIIKQKTDCFNILAVILLVLFAVLLFINNSNARLYADDYLYSFKFNPGFLSSSQAGVTYDKIGSFKDYFASLRDIYNNLTGRIVAHGLLQMLLMLPGWMFDVLNTLAILLLTFLMAKWAGYGKDKHLLLFWVLALLLYYTAISHTIPNLYYPAFSCNYVWTQMIVMLFLIPFLKLNTEDEIRRDKSVFLILLMFLGGIIAGDTNEPVVPGLLLAWGVMGIYLISTGKKIPLWYYAAFAGLLAGFALLFLAPGNNIRAMYETRNSSNIHGITFSPDNLKLIIFSSIGIVPALILGILGFIKSEFRSNHKVLLLAAKLLLIIIGIVFALLFSPIYIQRMNILFVGFVIALSLTLLSGSRLSKPGWLLVFILILLPLAGVKIYKDYNQLKMAKAEFTDFETKLLNSPSDSVLVYPGAYLDPLTRENWARPVAEYYGKSEVRLINDLDSLYVNNSRFVSYQKYSETANNGIDLGSLKFLSHSKYANTLYITLKIDTLLFKPEAIDISAYSADNSPEFISKLSGLLPLRIQKYVLSDQPGFKPVQYIEINGSYVYSVIVRNRKAGYDVLRLRITSGKRKVEDMIFNTVYFSGLN
jgi:hypothetical protein